MNYLGTDDVSDLFPYWAGTVAAIATPLIEFLLKRILQRNRIPQAERAFNNSWRTYLQFSFKLLDITTILYAYMRYLQLLAHKIQENIIFQEDKNNCKTIYRQIAYIADYICSICGNWDDLDVYYKDINSSQGCLTTLMRQSRDASFILSRLKQLKSTADFSILDFTHQEWTNWSDEDFSQILKKISGMTQQLELLDLSRIPGNTATISNGKTNAIVNFIHAVKIKILKLDNLIFDREQALSLSNGFSDTNIMVLHAINTTVAHEGSSALRTSVPLANFITLNLENNEVVDQDIPMIMSGLINSSVTNLILSKNKATENGFKIIFDNINKTQIDSIGLSGSSLSRNALDKLGDVISQNPTKSLKLASCDLSGQGMINFARKLANSLLLEFDLSNHRLDSSVFSYVLNRMPYHIDTLELNDIAWDNECISILSEILQKLSIRKLSLRNSDFSSDQLLDVMKAVSQSSISELDISVGEIDDDCAHEIAIIYSNNNHNLTRINVSFNKLSDHASSELYLAIIKPFVREMNFSGNALSSEFSGTLSNNLMNLETVDISGSFVNSNQFLQIATAAKDSALSHMSANSIQLDDDGAIKFGCKLITADQCLSYLGNENLSKDERRALSRSKSDMKFIFLSLQDNAQMTDAGRRALHRAAQQASTSNGNFLLDQPTAVVNVGTVTANTQLRILSILSSGEDNVENNSVSNILPAVVMSALLLICFYRILNAVLHRFTSRSPRLFSPSLQKVAIQPVENSSTRLELITSNTNNRNNL